MRKLLLFLALAGVIAWMYWHPDDVRRWSKAGLTSLSHYSGKLAGLEEAKPEESGPALKDIPDGVYCLTQPVRFTTATGTTVQPEGTLVRKTGEGGGKLIVTDEMGAAIVDMSVLTRDVATVARLAQGNAEAQQAQDSAAQKATAQKLAEIDAKLASLRAELAAIQRRDSDASRRGGKVAFGTPEGFVRASIARLEKARADVVASQKPAPAPAPATTHP